MSIQAKQLQGFLSLKYAFLQWKIKHLLHKLLSLFWYLLFGIVGFPLEWMKVLCETSTFSVFGEMAFTAEKTEFW